MSLLYFSSGYLLIPVLLFSQTLNLNSSLCGTHWDPHEIKIDVTVAGTDPTYCCVPMSVFNSFQKPETVAG